MKKRAYMIFVLTLIVCLELIGCSSGAKDDSLEEMKESTANVTNNYMEQYQAFLRGDISAVNKSGEAHCLKDLCLNYDAEKSNIKYSLFDMTGDEIPELHILTEAAYNILTMNDEQLAIWYEADYHSRPLNNRAILEKVESTGVHYSYTLLDNKGDVIFRCGFSEPAGDKLPFLFNCGEGDVELTEKEWDKLTKPFLSIGSDKIGWKKMRCKQTEVTKGEEQPAAMPTESVQNTKTLNAKDVRIMKKEIDARVKTVKDSSNFEYNEDYYDGDILAYKYFEQGSVSEENCAGYHLYYDAQGKLIYAEIIHYRDAHYSIYFYNDELLCTEPETLAKRVRKTFLSKDISLCLEYAY